MRAVIKALRNRNLQSTSKELCACIIQSNHRLRKKTLASPTSSLHMVSLPASYHPTHTTSSPTSTSTDSVLLSWSHCPRLRISGESFQIIPRLPQAHQQAHPQTQCCFHGLIARGSESAGKAFRSSHVSHKLTNKHIQRLSVAFMVSLPAAQNQRGKLSDHPTSPTSSPTSTSTDSVLLSWSHCPRLRISGESFQIIPRLPQAHQQAHPQTQCCFHGLIARGSESAGKAFRSSHVSHKLTNKHIQRLSVAFMVSLPAAQNQRGKLSDHPTSPTSSPTSTSTDSVLLSWSHCPRLRISGESFQIIPRPSQAHQQAHPQTQCCFHGLIARGSESAGKAFRSSHVSHKLTNKHIQRLSVAFMVSLPAAQNQRGKLSDHPTSPVSSPTSTSKDSVLLSWSHCPRLRISGESFQIIRRPPQAYQQAHPQTQCCFHGLIARGSESAGKAFRSSHVSHKLTNKHIHRLSVAFMVSLPAAQNQRGKLSDHPTSPTSSPTSTSKDSVLLSWSHCPRLRISGESFQIIPRLPQAHQQAHPKTQCCFHGLIARGSESAGKAFRSSHVPHKLTNKHIQRLTVAFMVSLPAAQNQRGKLSDHPTSPTSSPTSTFTDSVLLSWSHCPRLRISGESFQIITRPPQAHQQAHPKTHCCFHGLIARGSESAGKAFRSSHVSHKLTNKHIRRLSAAFMVPLPGSEWLLYHETTCFEAHSRNRSFRDSFQVSARFQAADSRGVFFALLLWGDNFWYLQT